MEASEHDDGSAWPRRWRGRWIWSGPAPLSVDAAAQPTIDRDAARGVALLRRSVTLDEVPERAPARLTGDSRFVLWVNDVEVARGPIRARPERLHYEEVDLAPHLQPGLNVVAALVRHLGHPTPWWMPAPPTYGLGGGAFVFEARLGDEWLVSDAGWKALAADAWRTLPASGISGVAPEWLDARDLPAGWQGWGFDDSAWAAATELGLFHVGWDGRPGPPVDPYGPLRPSPIGPLGGATREGQVIAAAVTTESEPVADPVEQVRADLQAATTMRRIDPKPLPFPVQLSHKFDAGVIVVDLGQQVAGVVGVEIDAQAGTILDAQAAEQIDEDGRPETLQQHSGLRYVARGFEDRIETLDPIGLRYLTLSMRGEGTVTVRSVTVRERLAPRPNGPFFACSDPLLEQIWRAGRRTVDLCSQDAYLDCPSREQRAWTGDAVVHQMVDLTTNPDWRLARWNVELAASPRPDGLLPMAVAGDFEFAAGTTIPDWSLHWIHALHNLALYTGDKELVRELLPIAERIVRWFEPFRGPDGLLADVTGWVLIDWSAVSVAGASATLNALWGRALREVKALAELVGDQGRAEWAGSRWVQLRKAFAAFWDPERQVFVDHLVDGQRRRPVSQHANAAAVVARLTRGVDVEALMARVTDPERLVSASWLMPGREARLHGAGDMYAEAAALVSGPVEPWWDVEHQIVAAQPFFRYVVHDALATAELADRIPAACRDWGALLERDPGTLSEVWYGGSHCHGWSATPTRDLMQQTLGITPASPGFGRARVAPALGDLTWARGAAPTPFGLLTVDVSPERLELDTPVDTDVVFAGHDTRVPAGHHVLE